MKKNLIRALSMAGSLAMLITMGTLNTSMAQSDRGGGRIEGTWDNQIRIIDCNTGNTITTFESLIVFMAGGTLTESTSGTAPALRTPGQGVWRHTTDNNYAFR